MIRGGGATEYREQMVLSLEKQKKSSFSFGFLPAYSYLSSEYRWGREQSWFVDVSYPFALLCRNRVEGCGVSTRIHQQTELLHICHRWFGKFAAIDFETANNERSSVCSVGIVIVRNGEIVDSFYSLIQPEPNYYNYWCSQVHGLCHEDADDAPVFPKVWAQIEPLIEGLPLVDHNKPFDEGCLKAVFRVYQMDYPDYEFYDTLAASRRAFRYLENHQLHTVAAECGYCLENHHNALADAEACAWIAREIL